MATLPEHLEDVAGVLKAAGYPNVEYGYIRDVPSAGAVIISITRGSYAQQASYNDLYLDIQFLTPAHGERDTNTYKDFIRKLEAGGDHSIRALFLNTNLPRGAAVVIGDYRVPTTVERLSNNRIYYSVVVEARLYIPAQD